MIKQSGKERITFKQAAVKQYYSSGTPIEVTEQFLSRFVPDEGELISVYGRIGAGKTTMAVSMIRRDLMRGKIVYSSFPVTWDGYDQRNSIFWTFVGVLGFKKQFYVYPKENWRQLDVFRDDIWGFLDTLKDCKLYFDDVIVKLFDSYEKTGYAKQKREWAFFTRHYDRTIVLVTQRTSQIQVALRSQVNRFYKCEKLLKWPILLFRRSEYQDMKMEDVNEDVKPDSVRFVIGRKAVFKMFNSKYLRKGAKSSQPFYVEAFKLNWLQRSLAFMFALVRPLKRTHKVAESVLKPSEYVRKLIVKSEKDLITN